MSITTHFQLHTLHMLDGDKKNKQKIKLKLKKAKSLNSFGLTKITLVHSVYFKVLACGMELGHTESKEKKRKCSHGLEVCQARRV